MRNLLMFNSTLQRFFIGQTLQRTSDWIDIIVLNWAILHLTQDPMALATLNMMRLLPQLIFAILTGKIVDLMDTVKLMYSVHLLNIIFTVLICISFYTHHLFSIYDVLQYVHIFNP
ncbi:hypothetical protein [Macrococcus animalis]|uniref:hypothetical protein n=1 Tax=Macrococcus animalis TaxID=3395467 RepID=UPI0039BDB44D